MNIPGQGDAVIEVDFHNVAGNRLPKKGIFSLILDFIVSLALNHFPQQVSRAQKSDANPPVWKFFIYNNIPDMTQKLHVYQVIALLQAVTQFYVKQQIWQEMVFHLVIYGRVVAGGCVTEPDESRKWCNGMELPGVDMRGEGLRGL